ncbi:hypothetical protein [Streptomyces sp. NPDC051132]|uniref:hypothetical protein n=1 Tax=unclassified Streptomyces TaxID=2593676 RepID=UPI0034397CF3
MSTVDEVRQVTRGGSAAITALWSGSMILGGRLCGCVATAVRWAWDQASRDPEATAAAQAAAGQPVRRPVPETLGMLAIAGMLAAGALGTVGTLAWPHLWPYVQMLAPWRGLILTVGGLAWMTAAWMVAPPLPVAEAPAEEVDEPGEFADEDLEEGEGPADEPTVSDRLARHVLAALAELESAGKSGVHVSALIASAEEAQILAPGTFDKAGMRRWLEASGLPVTKSVKVQGDVDYGVRVDRVTEALGMGPAEALARLAGGGAQTAPPAPATAPAQAPAEAPTVAPAGVPLPAAAAPAHSPRLALVTPLPDDGSHGSAQGAA